MSAVPVPVVRCEAITPVTSKERRMHRGAKPAKSKVEAKPPVARKSLKSESSRVHDLEQRLAEALRDKAEAQEQQAATAEILRVIGASPTDVQPVFDAIASSAARLCSTYDVFIRRLEGNGLRLVAHYGPIPASALIPVMRGSVSGRAVLERRTVHVVDVQGAADEFPEGATLGREFGVRTNLGVPLLREGVPLGAIVMRRTETKPFTDEEIALLQTFADQAVIAIENVRLFKELEARNRELTEALGRETATSEILRTISAAHADAQPVFEAIVQNAVRLCGAAYGGVYRFDGKLIHSVAHYNFTPDQLEQWRRLFPRPPVRKTPLDRAINCGSVVRISDAETDPDSEFPAETLLNLRARGVHSMLIVPMFRHSDVIGVISLVHQEVGAFSDAHIELLQTFADQAVIAIENVRLFKELEGANRELSVASQHKSEFLANMSHELRTPLNAIIGFSEVLSERMFGDLNEKQEEYLKDIYASGTHLLSLINDILDLSKIEAGRMELELTDFDLPTALDNALTLVRERAGRRNITLRTSVDERLGEVRADERKIRQVVLNLLSNAIKFTPESGRIEVAAVPRDGSVEISVADTGVGIAREDHEAVFEEFRQVGTADKKVEGTGLGLTLCRKFVELHGGRIWVKSEVGVGSTFTFTIPVRRGE